MQFVVSGQRIAVENFVTGKLYTILWRNDTEVNLMCTSIGADCVVFQGEAPLNLFTLTMKNADTIDTIEPTQLGTTNYNNLINKPSINGVDLIGNKTSSALGIRDVPAVIEADEGKVLTAADDGSYSWQVIPEGTTDYTDLSNKPQINSVTLSGNLSLSDLGAAAAADIPTTPADIGAEPAITSENMLDADLVDDTCSTHKFATAAQLAQIATNENNILKLMPTAYTTPRINTEYGLTLVWGGYAKVGNLCVVNMRLSCTTDIPAGTFLAYDLPKSITTTGLSAGSIFCSLTNSLGLNIALITDFDSNKSNIANNLASGTIPAGNIILSGMYLCATE